MNNDTSKQRRNRAWCYRSVVELPMAHYMVPFHNHTQIPYFIPLEPLFPFSCSTHTPATFPNSHNHRIHNTIQSFPFTGTHTTPPLSSLSPSTPTSHSLHQPHWDPVINNECTLHTLLMLETQLKCICYTLIYKR